MSELKLCKDCKHYREGRAVPPSSFVWPAQCVAPPLTRVSPETGLLIWKDKYADHTPLTARDSGPCGEDGTLFEPAPPPLPAPKEESLGFFGSIASMFRR